jgi:hypothetical protein
MKYLTLSDGWVQDIEVNNIFSDEEGRLPLEDAKRLVLKNLRILEVNTSLSIFVLLLCSAVDPDSMGPLDQYPDPDAQYGSGSRRAKMTHKHRKKIINFSEVLDVLF